MNSIDEHTLRHKAEHAALKAINPELVTLEYAVWGVRMTGVSLLLIATLLLLIYGLLDIYNGQPATAKLIASLCFMIVLVGFMKIYYGRDIRNHGWLGAFTRVYTNSSLVDASMNVADLVHKES